MPGSGGGGPPGCPGIRDVGGGRLLTGGASDCIIFPPSSMLPGGGCVRSMLPG